MIKVNFKFKFATLNGKVDPATETNKLIAETIAGGNTPHPQRMTEIARKIYNSGEVELVSEDEKLVREAILRAKGLTDLFKAQALDQMDKAAAKKPK